MKIIRARADGFLHQRTTLPCTLFRPCLTLLCYEAPRQLDRQYSNRPSTHEAWLVEATKDISYIVALDVLHRLRYCNGESVMRREAISATGTAKAFGPVLQRNLKEKIVQEPPSCLPVIPRTKIQRRL